MTNPEQSDQVFVRISPEDLLEAAEHLRHDAMQILGHNELYEGEEVMWISTNAERLAIRGIAARQEFIEVPLEYVMPHAA
ncbi:hypothetical protein KW803_02230 [Candidatus Saccharibacteria bacterium]|nr:hypothetical protein [Candidatus Saccharibacteria bacterium]